MFKEKGGWYLPPDNIETVKKVIEEALRNAKYSIDPIRYYQEMRERYEKILELEKLSPGCTCGIKFSGNIYYIPQCELVKKSNELQT